ncbi:MAG: pilus assembly protein PilP [Gammaproteobacteria bacterium]|nr:MAG: pilus assembly protein PilP [Gammaproteobacteria bacterium]
MALQDSLRSLQEVDFNNLDFESVGTWPLALKVIVWLITLVLVLGLGYMYHVKGLQEGLARVEAKELQLRKEFEQKAFQAANLDAYRKQMVEMEESFGALVGQLPSDTEVPGLLEDITNKGLLNGLEIHQIKLEKERAREFYVELPISIEASGTYHDLGAFISGMAGLPRIVTLHDFSIAQSKKTGMLDLSILAKTYRYKDSDEDGGA